MSVADSNKVDGIGITKDGQGLILLLADHLDWSHEYDHLIQLQNKLNSYVAFLENKQYEENYPNRKFTSFFIEIHFMYEPVTNCNKFIEVAKKQLKDIGIHIDVIVE